MGENIDIIAIGESLIELSSNKSLKVADCFDKYYGGDALVSAITASRLGSKAGYITTIADDYFAQFLTESWQNEGLDISRITCNEGANGIYFVANTHIDRREFAFYRRKTAMATFSVDDIDEDYIKSASCIYATGIAQSISPNCREAVRHAFKIAKENNVLVAYDPNFNPNIWDKEEAREAYDEVEEYLDILFMSAKHDTTALFGIDSPDKMIQHLADKGIVNIVIKKDGYYTSNASADTVFTPYYIKECVDSTGAGDCFNGAFLHAITNGMSEIEATELASVVASLQAQNIGSIRSIPSQDLILKHFRGLDV